VKFLVDANVISEITKPLPSSKVREWLRRHEEDMAVDPVILGEIQIGILQLPASRKRKELERWFAEVVAGIICLPWDAATSARWAELVVSLRRSGNSMPIKDSMIAASALAHDLTMVTRNNSDFKKAGLKVVNPFE
jgi:predicted nucleic acid-binding protein